MTEEEPDDCVAASAAVLVPRACPRRRHPLYEEEEKLPVPGWVGMAVWVQSGGMKGGKAKMASRQRWETGRHRLPMGFSQWLSRFV